MQNRRKTHIVDKDVQGALVLRVVVYWVACLWGIFCVLAGSPMLASWCFNLPNAPTPAEVVYETWLDFWPAILASFLVLPVLVRDVIRLSNRFVGPFLQLRKGLKTLAQGQPVRPIRFRKGDFWYEVAEDFNQVAELVAGQSEQDDRKPAAEKTSDDTPPETVEQQPEELVEAAQ